MERDNLEDFDLYGKIVFLKKLDRGGGLLNWSGSG